jgi:hypothetical protein
VVWFWQANPVWLWLALKARRYSVTSWSKAVEDYVDMRRSLRFRLQEARTGLMKFASFLELQRAEQITIRLAMEWAQQDKTARPVEWATRLTFAQVVQHHNQR